MQIKLCKMAQLLMLNQFTARFELLNYLLFLIANLTLEINAIAVLFNQIK